MGSEYLCTVADYTDSNPEYTNQLKTQDTRWQRVETELANQSSRMNQIEAQISQFNVLQQKVADTEILHP